VREKNILPIDLLLEVNLKEKEGKVEGKATYTFVYLRKEIDTVFFDAIQFDVKTIKINDEAISFRVDSAGIVIYLPPNRTDTSILTIEYAAYPERGMYFVNWNNPDPKAYKQIWTQGQGIDNRHWIPGFDDVANLQTVTTKITFNERYPVVSNGNLISTSQNTDHTKTWTYKLNERHALYLIMIAAGDYKMKTLKSKAGVQIDQYYYPDKEDCFEATYQHSEVMMDWFESEIGVPYAWNKIYRNVPTRDFLFGAMENTSSTIFADYMHQNARAQLERAYLNVNAHELAHNWFGDLITERSAHHHWLHESFATHYSKHFIKYLKGTEEFDAGRLGELGAAFGAGMQNTLPVAHSASGSPRHYPKGSFVLDMLRNELGNDNFRKSIQYYLRKHYHQNVETSDLIAAIYEMTGRNVDWFFDQWIYRGGEPMIDVDFKIEGHRLEMITNQTQKMESTVREFRLPMKATIYYKSGLKEQHNALLKHGRDVHVFLLKENEVFDYLVLDENVDFLRKIRYTKGDSYDKLILNKSTSYTARWEAVTRLNKTSWKDKKSTYLEAFHKETSQMVKREILSQVMLNEEDEIAEDIVMHGLKDKHHLVRRNAIQAINVANQNIKPWLVSLLQDSSYINIENAFNKLCVLYPEEKAKWLQAIEQQDGINNNLSILYYSKTLKENNQLNLNSIKGLKYIASESSEYRARIPAITALMDNKIWDEEIVTNLIQGALHFHPGIRGTCIQNLKIIKKESPDLFIKAVEKFPFSAPRKTQVVLMKRIN
jgi:aminopeptidase N